MTCRVALNREEAGRRQSTTATVASQIKKINNHFRESYSIAQQRAEYAQDRVVITTAGGAMQGEWACECLLFPRYHHTPRSLFHFRKFGSLHCQEEMTLWQIG